MKGKRDPRFQQVYSPPFIFVRKSFQDANNDTSQPFSAHPLLVERTFWSAIYDIPPLFSAHPLLRLPKVKSKDFPRKVYIPL